MKLSVSHFAFLRGWVQGLDERSLWARYLPQMGSFDARRCRKLRQELVHELGAVARRHGHPERAALLRRHGEAIFIGPDGAPEVSRQAATEPAARQALPTLEDIRARFDEDFFSEAELLEVWQDEVAQLRAAPPSPAASATDAPSPALPRARALARRARLIERQLEALGWLEHLAAESPQLADPLPAWLDDSVSERLARAGMLTLGDLMTFISLKGYRWYMKVPRLGEKGANLITSFLQSNPSLGPFPAHALVPARQLPLEVKTSAHKRGVMVPLERFSAPATLLTAEPGAPGSNRAPVVQCKLLADNDLKAIGEWLSMRTEGTHTWRAYRREAERFLLWAVLERQKPLSGLLSADCVAYRDFLASPAGHWCGQRHAPRWSPAWRPFEGPLSAASALTAQTILSGMCDWLAKRRYLDSNPWDGVPPGAAAPSMPTLRSLSRKQWRLVEEWLEELDDTPASARLKLLMGFGYRSGMREAELSAARVSWLRFEDDGDGEGGEGSWSIMVLGKRNRWREVALPSSAVRVLQEDFRSKGLSPDLLTNPPDTPLVSAVTGARTPITPGRIYEVVREGFEQCAVHVEAMNPKAAARIRLASTHWLRHTYAAHAVETMPLEVLQAQLGHQSPATTAVYARAERTRKQTEVRRAFDRS